MIKRICATVLLVVCIFLLFSCSNSEIKSKNSIFYEYFDTVSVLYDYSGLSNDKFAEISDKVETLLREYHMLYDIYNEYDGITNIATLNRTAGKGPQKVDKKIIDMLLFSKEMFNITKGKVNVAMGAVLAIWHDYREEGVRVPSTELLEKAAEHTNINNIVIDEVNMTVELTDYQMSLDVGAVAKGYAVEMIANMLETDGHSGCVIDVGGNLRTVGAKPNGDGWSAGVKNPDMTFSQAYVYKFNLKNEALVTSGSYERFYTVGGVRYHHIINGETLMPENFYTSVSVKSDSSALSDALSTAIFNMRYEEAKMFIEGFSNIIVVLVMPDGEVRVVYGK